MKPYYSQSGVEIYHGDCREFLDALPLIEIGHMLTDPPYGIALANHARGKRRSNRSFAIAGDVDQVVGQEVLTWAHERNVAVTTFANPLRPWLGPWRQCLVWDKGPAVGGGGDPETLWKQSWELIQTSGHRRGGERDSSVLNFWVTPLNSVLHPAAKPEALMLYLIERLTGSVLVIVDPFMGSGTTLVAAKRLGRSAIGIELEEKYCEIAAKRLQQEALPLEVA